MAAGSPGRSAGPPSGASGPRPQRRSLGWPVRRPRPPGPARLGPAGHELRVHLLRERPHHAQVRDRDLPGCLKDHPDGRQPDRRGGPPQADAPQHADRGQAVSASSSSSGSTRRSPRPVSQTTHGRAADAWTPAAQTRPWVHGRQPPPPAACQARANSGSGTNSPTASTDRRKRAPANRSDTGGSPGRPRPGPKTEG